MNKQLAVVLGVAAVATFSGCLDPDWNDRVEKAINGGEAIPVAEPAETTAVPVSDTAVGEEVTVIAVDTKSCTCPKGTVHETPCACGAENCVCEVKEPEVKTPVTPVAMPVAEAETTVYIVQRGDYLAKISKKYNVKIDAIKKLNPSIKDDNVVRLGQKILLPGKIEVGEQTVPAGAVKAAPEKVYRPYDGATKEYVVKAGDTLGAIAYGNGINVRQLKELNGLSSNTIRVGQKLKIPADKAVAAAPVAVEERKPLPVKKTEQPVTAVEQPADEPVAPAVEAPVVEDAVAAAPVAEGPTHVVKEGEDLLGLALIYSLDPAEIRALNNLGENENTLKPGQVIRLPADANL